MVFAFFLLNRECFPLNRLLDLLKKLLPQKFSRECSFSIRTEKVFPLECFAVYSTQVDDVCTMMMHCNISEN